MFCSKCGESLETLQAFCPNCGQSTSDATPYKPVSNGSWRNLKPLLLLPLILCLLFGVLPRIVSWQAEKAVQKEEEDRAVFHQKLEVEFQQLSAGQHLEKARQLLVAGARQEEVELGERHLAALPSGTPEYAQGKTIQKQYEADAKIQAQHLKAAEQEKVAADAATNRILRDLLAKAFENNLLNLGYDVDVNAVGKDHTTLRIKWLFVSKVLAHQLSQKPDFFEEPRKLGFKRIEITDGYDETWYWTLK
jgi:hypothetical protein